MPIKNFSLSASTELIPAGPHDSLITRRHIKILAFWFELSANATLVSLRFGDTGEDMFPKTLKGLAALNLIGCGQNILSPKDTNLYLYINGTVTVRGTIVYKYV